MQVHQEQEVIEHTVVGVDLHVTDHLLQVRLVQLVKEWVVGINCLLYDLTGDPMLLYRSQPHTTGTYCELCGTGTENIFLYKTWCYQCSVWIEQYMCEWNGTRGCVKLLGGTTGNLSAGSGPVYHGTKCATCNDTGKVTVSKSCGHGFKSVHSYCSHGYSSAH